MNVAILLRNEAELLDIAAPAQVFVCAGEGAAFHVYTVAATPSTVVIGDFLSIHPEYTVQQAPPPDVVVVPGGGSHYVTYGSWLAEWLREAFNRATFVLCIGTGTLVPAAAGLLDGLEVTTAEPSLDLLRRAAPGATVRDDRRWVVSGKLITATDALAGMECALYITGRLLGDRFARAASRCVGWSRG